MFSSNSLLQAPNKWHSVCLYPVLDVQHSRRTLFMESVVTSLVTSSRLSGPASMSSQVDICLKNSKTVLGGCSNNHKVWKSHQNGLPWTECHKIKQMKLFYWWWINYMWSLGFGFCGHRILYCGFWVTLWFSCRWFHTCNVNLVPPSCLLPSA